MSAAPGVLIEIRSACPVWVGMTRGVAACCASGLLAWTALHHLYGQDPNTAWFATAVTAASLVAVTGLLRRPAPHGKLLWNTQDWVWHEEGSSTRDPLLRGETGTVRIALDLGVWLLVRFDAHRVGAQPVWLPLSKTRFPSQWHALNCALRNPASAGAVRSTG